jgi:hypothetical protein
MLRCCFKIGELMRCLLAFFFSGLRGQAGDATGWLCQPHALELRRPRQGRRKPHLTPQSSPKIFCHGHGPCAAVCWAVGTRSVECV